MESNTYRPTEQKADSPEPKYFGFDTFCAITITGERFIELIIIVLLCILTTKYIPVPFSFVIFIAAAIVIFLRTKPVFGLWGDCQEDSYFGLWGDCQEENS